MLTASEGADDAPDIKLLNLFKQLDIAVNPELFELALTHRSYAYEHDQSPHNERLEFLGDAVLGAIVTEHLYRQFPDYPEGKLAKLRAGVVSAKALGEVGADLGIGHLIKLGRGEQATGGAKKTSILADTMEAIIGAVYLSSGPETAQRYVLHVFGPKIEQADRIGQRLDPKTALQEIAAHFDTAASYEVAEEGPDHAKVFTAYALVGKRRYGPGVAGSKKHAEQLAAATAYEKLSAEIAELQAQPSNPAGERTTDA